MHKIHSHSFPFLYGQFPFLPISKFMSYSYSHWIPIGLLPFSSHFQTRTTKQYRPILYAISRQLRYRKTVPQKTGHQSLKNSTSNNTIHSALTIRQKFPQSSFKMLCQLWWNSATETNPREFFSLANRGHFHSRLRSIPHFPISLFVIHQYGSII